MSVNIAVLGLDQVGVSAALALHSKHKSIICRGWDPDLEKRASADRFKVFDPICKSMKEAVKDAALIIMRLVPNDFKSIIPEMWGAYPAGTVLVNMSLLQAPPAQWLKEKLGRSAQTISLFPTLNPEYIHDGDCDTAAAKADLFQSGVIYISDPARSNAVVLDLAVDLAVLLGGTPKFADPQEMDGLISSNILLPKLAAAALMLAVSSQPSWREGQQIAGPDLAAMTTPLLDGFDKNPGQAMIANRENMLRLLGDLSGYIEYMNQKLQEDNVDALDLALKKSRDEREGWLREKKQVIKNREIATSIPTEAQALERFLNLGK